MLIAFSWFPLAATLRVNVRVVFPPLYVQLAPATADPPLGVVSPVDQYRLTVSGEPEHPTMSALVMPLPTPKATQAFPS